MALIAYSANAGSLPKASSMTDAVTSPIPGSRGEDLWFDVPVRPGQAVALLEL